MAIASSEKISSQVRRDIIRMVTDVQSGHPGGSLGCADFMTLLFFEIMDIKPENWQMDGKGEDIFILSNGHISPCLYSVLAHKGYFDKKELSTFRRLGSRLQGHPTPDKGLPGVRIATGSLGQGLSVGIGTALAKKLNGDQKLVFTLHGDGELQEGQIWEAAMYAAANKVDKLIATIDYNHKQIDGDIDDVLPMGDLKQKWQAFGWEVLEMNGHDFISMRSTLKSAKEKTGKGKPVVIIMNTIMGKGVDFMEDTHKWHGSPPSKEQAEKALAAIEETTGDY
ncbi:MAG: transketolase [Crocinitomicaceae bacterium]|nr:transketolase [Crocinitomicaceae bacterium]